jgi:hypothetical protein
MVTKVVPCPTPEANVNVPPLTLDVHQVRRKTSGEEEGTRNDE